MDFLIEFVIELVGGILEVSIESDRVPKWVRYCLMGILVSGLAMLFGTLIFDTTEIALQIILAVISLALMAGGIYLIYNIYRSGELRQAKKEELPAIVRMYRSVIGKPGCTWSVTYPNEVDLYNDFNHGTLYVLYKSKKLIGAGSIVPKNELDDLKCWSQTENAREIARLVIAPEYQNKGYGKHLVNKLCLRLDKMGCKAVHLLVSTGNAHALKLYKKTGFRERGSCNRYGHDYFAYERSL